MPAINLKHLGSIYIIRRKLRIIFGHVPYVDLINAASLTTAKCSGVAPGVAGCCASVLQRRIIYFPGKAQDFELWRQERICSILSSHK